IVGGGFSFKEANTPLLANVPTNDRPAPTSERSATVQAAIALLVEAFPKTFFMYERRRLPLKLGIHLDILAVMAGVITPEELSAALRYYVSNDGYLRACRQGAVRIDLNGQSAGEVLAADGHQRGCCAGGAAAPTHWAEGSAGGAWLQAFWP